MSNSPLKKYFEKSALKSHKPGHNPSWLNNPDNFEDDTEEVVKERQAAEQMDLANEKFNRNIRDKKPIGPVTTNEDELPADYDENAYREND